MSATAAVTATRLPQGVEPTTLGLYSFFPYTHVVFFDGKDYHALPPAPAENPLDSPSPNTLHVNDQAPNINSPALSQPEIKPVNTQVDDDKVLEIDLIGDDSKLSENQIEFTFKVPNETRDASPSEIEAKRNGEDIAAEVEKKTDSVSNSGWNSLRPNGKNDAESEWAAAPVPVSKSTPTNESESKTTTSQSPAPPASSVVTDGWNLPSTTVTSASSQSGWMSEPPRELPHSRSVATSGDNSTAQHNQKQQPTTASGWGDNQNDHVAKNDPLPSTPVIDDTKKASIPPSTSKPGNIAAGIQEWQMISKMNEQRDAQIRARLSSTSSESNGNACDVAANKVASLAISQSVENSLEPKVDPKLELALDVTGNAGTTGRSSCAENVKSNTTDTPRDHLDDMNESVKLKDVASSGDRPSAQQVKPTNTMNGSTSQSSSSMWATKPAPPSSRSNDWAPTVPRGDLLLRLKVKLPDGKFAFLEFHEGDCPQDIAERWCRVWRIPDAVGQAKIITEGIRAQLEKTKQGIAAQN